MESDTEYIVSVDLFNNVYKIVINRVARTAKYVVAVVQCDRIDIGVLMSTRIIDTKSTDAMIVGDCIAMYTAACKKK